MRWIRWKGAIAFVVLAAAGALFWFVFADYLVRRAVEKGATVLLGAEVNVRKADLSLFPLGLVIEGIEAANPDAPRTNAVEVRRAAFRMDAGRLLLRKVTIEDMAIEGVRFNTERRRPGRVVSKKKEGPGLAEKARASLGLPSLKIPDVKEILEKEELSTLKLASKLKAEMEAEKKAWAGRVRELPDEKKFEAYKKRIDALGAAGRGDEKGLSGVIGAANEAAALQKEITVDIERIRKASASLEGDIGRYRLRAAEAMRAPEEDFRRLREKYSPGAAGLKNLGAALLGREAAGWIDSALVWKDRLEPFLSRSLVEKGGVKAAKPVRAKGVDVVFKEREPAPEFLVRRAAVSVSIAAGDMGGAVRDFTTEQHITGRPVAFELGGEGLQGLGSMSLSGEIDRVRSERPRDTISLKASGYRVRDISLAGPEPFPVTLSEAALDLSADIRFSGPAFEADVRASASGARISAAVPDGAGPVAAALAGALEGVKGFNVGVKASGTAGGYSTAITTDLDRVLSAAAGEVIRKDAARFERALNEAITERTAGVQPELKGSLGGLEAVMKELAGRSGTANALLGEIGAGKAAPMLPGGIRLPF